MNTNRTKYASTPTFGMQKRGFVKKPPAAAQTASAPDFTQQPASGAMPFPQAAIPMPSSAAAMPDSMLFGAPNGALPPMGAQPMSGMSAPMNPMMPPMSGMNAPASSMGMPMSGLSTPMPAMGAPMNAMNPLNGMNAPMAAGAQMAPPMSGSVNPYGMPQTFGQPMGAPMGNQPLGNSVTPFGTMNGSPKAQGFVPPTVTEAPFAPYAAPSAVPPAQGFQQQFTGTMPNLMNTVNATPNLASFPSFSSAPNAARPQARPPRQPIDGDKLLKAMLFGVLPVLFIPCVFVSHLYDFLRYIFLTLTVITLGVMWYRNSFTQGFRTTFSVIYVALGIAAIGLLLNTGGRDVTQTSANIGAGQQPSVQESAAPDVPVEAAVSATTTPDVDSSGDEAQARLTTFMDLWTVNKIEDMSNFVQPSWASQQDNAASALFSIISNRTPSEYVLESIDGASGDSSRTVTMSAYIDKNNGKDPVRYRFQILMVKEGGEWYIDPKTLATNDDISSETVVAATQEADASFTLAPRMTVTPAPAGDTKLYYNANGGSYYHADPNCSAVNAKYLPLASFLYSELSNAPYSSLQPCLKCGAPTKALSTTTE